MEDNYKKVPLLDKHNKNEVDKIIKEYNNLFREIDELKVKIEKMKYNEISSFKPVIIQINAFGDKIKKLQDSSYPLYDILINKAPEQFDQLFQLSRQIEEENQKLIKQYINFFI